MNYAQKELRKVTQALDANEIQQQIWNEMFDRKEVAMTLCVGSLSVVLPLSERAWQDVRDIADSVLAKEASDLQNEEVRWCNEVVLLRKQQDDAVQQRLAAQ